MVGPLVDSFEFYGKTFQLTRLRQTETEQQLKISIDGKIDPLHGQCITLPILNQSAMLEPLSAQNFWLFYKVVAQEEVLTDTAVLREYLTQLQRATGGNGAFIKVSHAAIQESFGSRVSFYQFLAGFVDLSYAQIQPLKERSTEEWLVITKSQQVAKTFTQVQLEVLFRIFLETMTADLATFNTKKQQLICEALSQETWFDLAYTLMVPSYLHSGRSGFKLLRWLLEEPGLVHDFVKGLLIGQPLEYTIRISKE